MATSRTAKRIAFPVFETLRPIPPLAWVPLAILFWPTAELSITFVIFLGAFFPIVLNTVGGAEQIDRRYLLAARSLGAGRLTVFRRVILPASLPSIVTGAAVGMGITWEVVVAAELISGGGQARGRRRPRVPRLERLPGRRPRARGGRDDQPRRRRATCPAARCGSRARG